jgi:hypothetical protein
LTPRISARIVAAIRLHALRDLVETARGLPLVAEPEQVSFEAAGVLANAEGLAGTTAPRQSQAEASPRGPGPRGRDELRPAVASLLARMARRADESLAATLRRATEAWDQADAFAVIDIDLEGEIMVLRRRLAGAATSAPGAARRAVALEGILALDAAVALVRVFERRLATLLRLRLRSETPDLLPEGRPFLDLGRALREVAEAWR